MQRKSQRFATCLNPKIWVCGLLCALLGGAPVQAALSARERARTLLSQAGDAGSDYKRVLELCNRAAAIDPNYWRIYSYRGDAREHLGKSRAALNDYLSYKRLAPPGDLDQKGVAKRIKILKSKLVSPPLPTPEPSPSPKFAATPTLPRALFAPPALPDDGEASTWPPSSLNAQSFQSALNVTHKTDATESLHNVTALAWSPDGTSLATGSWSDTSGSSAGEIRLYKMNAESDAGEVATPDAIVCRSRFAWPYHGKGTKPPWLGHHGRVSALAWSPGGAMLASGGIDGSVMLWDADGAPLRVLRANAPDSQLGREIVAISWQSSTRLCGVESGGTLRTWKRRSVATSSWIEGGFEALSPQGLSAPGVGGISWVIAAAFSRDGKFLAAGDSSGAIGVYNAINGNRLSSFQNSQNQQPGRNGIALNALAFSPDGSWLASANFSHIYLNALPPANDDNAVATPAEAKDNRPVRYDARLFRSDQRVGALAWASDGRVLLARTDSRLLVLDTWVAWETTPLGDARLAPANLAPRLALSPRGNVLADASAGGSWRLLK